MDATAIVMCRDYRLPLRVFNWAVRGSAALMQGEDMARWSPTTEGEAMLEDLKKDAVARCRNA